MFPLHNSGYSRVTAMADCQSGSTRQAKPAKIRGVLEVKLRFVRKCEMVEIPKYETNNESYTLSSLTKFFVIYFTYTSFS